MAYGILFDVSLCIGCEACLEACQTLHEQPETDTSILSAYNFTVVKNKVVQDEDLYFRRMCMHCEDPSCASACIVGAFRKTKEGPVIYDSQKCIGCRYCMVACPFNVPKYEWDKALPLVKKCDMCYDRIIKGQPTACAEACPTEATLFGEREELIQIAKKRIQEEPDKYEPYIYGLAEAGGTSVLILSPVNFEELGFKIKNYQQAFPQNTWRVMREIPSVVGFGGVFLYGLWWIINRREKLQAIPVNDDGSAKKEDKR
jgi:formate dehydrogenase iron-sulfur subunit